MIYGIIPARLESTRLPRKMLLAETGKPLIQHTYEAARRAEIFDHIVIAVDSPEVSQAVQKFCEIYAETGDFDSGTVRVAHVAKQIEDDSIVVNIQGDEPEIEPHALAALIDGIRKPPAFIATLAAELAPGELEDPNVVKVTVDGSGLATDFTRTPYAGSHWLRHIGVYAFDQQGRGTLAQITKLPRHPDEIAQRLEQLRWLRNGWLIRVVTVESSARGIDTPEDYRRFVERVRHGSSPGVS